MGVRATERPSPVQAAWVGNGCSYTKNPTEHPPPPAPARSLHERPFPPPRRRGRDGFPPPAVPFLSSGAMPHPPAAPFARRLAAAAGGSQPIGGAALGRVAGGKKTKTSTDGRARPGGGAGPSRAERSRTEPSRRR